MAETLAIRCSNVCRGIVDGMVACYSFRFRIRAVPHGTRPRRERTNESYILDVDSGDDKLN